MVGGGVSLLLEVLMVFMMRNGPSFWIPMTKWESAYLDLVRKIVNQVFGKLISKLRPPILASNHIHNIFQLHDYSIVMNYQINQNIFSDENDIFRLLNLSNITIATPSL